MRAVVQRVREAAVDVQGREVARIGRGVVVLIGFSAEDAAKQLAPMAQAVLGIRLFDDERGRMNRVRIAGGSGRPSFATAAPSEPSGGLFEAFVMEVKGRHARVATGVFRASIALTLCDDGPVTFVIETARA